MKNKLKKKSFWLALAGAVIMLIQALGFKIDAPIINEIVTAACSVAIVLGIMIDDTKDKEEVAKIDESLDKEE